LASSGSQTSQLSLLLYYAIDRTLVFPISVVAIDNEEKGFQFKGVLAQRYSPLKKIYWI
jgi:hypothetical protein